MRSLEEIVRFRQAKRAKYESKNGEGSFNRKSIAHLEGKTVTASGVYVGVSGDMFTLREVSVGGIPVDHVNIFLPKGTKENKTIMPLLKQRISFSAQVYKYTSQARITYGLRNVKNILPTAVYRKRNAIIDTQVKARGYHYYDFAKQEMPFKLFQHEGFAPIKISTSIKSPRRDVIHSALSLHIRKPFGLLTNAEKELISLTENENPLELLAMLKHLSTKSSGVKFLELYKVARNFVSSTELVDIYKRAIFQTENFLLRWQGGKFRVLPLAKGLETYYGIPITFQAEDGSILFIVPQCPNEKFNAWNHGSLMYLRSTLSVPMGTKVTFYNPITNRIINTFTKSRNMENSGLKGVILCIDALIIVKTIDR